MKVRINKSSGECYWYGLHIGKEFEVERSFLCPTKYVVVGDVYKSIFTGHVGYFVREQYEEFRGRMMYDKLWFSSTPNGGGEWCTCNPLNVEHMVEEMLWQ